MDTNTAIWYLTGYKNTPPGIGAYSKNLGFRTNTSPQPNIEHIPGIYLITSLMILCKVCVIV